MEFRGLIFRFENFVEKKKKKKENLIKTNVSFEMIKEASVKSFDFTRSIRWEGGKNVVLRATFDRIWISTLVQTFFSFFKVDF